MTHYRRTTVARLAIAVLFLALALSSSSALAAEGVVNINTAGEGELRLLPRVGPALAARILAFREENGEFKNPQDLMLVRGIGEKTFALMESHVTVSGETTLKEKVRSTPTPTPTPVAEAGE